MIEEFSKCGRVDLACDNAGIGRATHYQWLAKHPDYRVAFEAAREPAADVLENEAWRRAITGVQKPVSIGGKREMVTEYSDRLLEILLQARRPEVFAQQRRVQLTGAAGGPVEMLTEIEIRLVPSAPALPPAVAYQVLDITPDTPVNGKTNGNGHNGNGHQ